MCSQIKRNPFYFFLLFRFGHNAPKLYFRTALRGSTLFLDMHRQLLRADMEMRLWMYEIDTVVVAKHNRKLLWREGCFDYRLSPSELWPKSSSTEWAMNGCTWNSKGRHCIPVCKKGNYSTAKVLKSFINMTQLHCFDLEFAEHFTSVSWDAAGLWRKEKANNISSHIVLFCFPFTRK